MDDLKNNPFIAEVEILLSSLGLDAKKAKHVVPTGELLYFNFNELPIYVCLPAHVPSSYSSIARIEAEIAELADANVGQLLVSIVTYLSIHDCTPIRVMSRRSHGQNTKVLIGFVCDLQFLQVGSLAPILLHICEVADQMRSEFLINVA